MSETNEPRKWIIYNDVNNAFYGIEGPALGGEKSVSVVALADYDQLKSDLDRHKRAVNVAKRAIDEMGFLAMRSGSYKAKSLRTDARKEIDEILKGET